MRELEIGEDGFSKVEIGVKMEAYSPSGELLKFKLREAKSKYVEQILKNNSDEEYKVLGNLNIKRNGSFIHFLIEFRDSTLLVVRGGSILRGKIKNPNKPSVYGVGYLGQGLHRCSNKGKATKEYTLWTSMLARSYSEDFHKKKLTYKDCSVAPRWHNFQNFCEDIKELEGYDKWLEGHKEKINPYQLDKDIKIDGNKIYSKDTCIFVTQVENNLKANLTGKLYKGVSPEGEEFIFDNINKFAREHGLHNGCISGCLRQERTQHLKWKFEIIKEIYRK